MGGSDLCFDFPLLCFLYPSTLIEVDRVSTVRCVFIVHLIFIYKIKSKAYIFIMYPLVQAELFVPCFSWFCLRTFSKILFIEHFKILFIEHFKMFQVLFYCTVAAGATRLSGGPGQCSWKVPEILIISYSHSSFLRKFAHSSPQGACFYGHWQDSVGPDNPAVLATSSRTGVSSRCMCTGWICIYEYPSWVLVYCWIRKVGGREGERERSSSSS